MADKSDGYNQAGAEPNPFMSGTGLALAGAYQDPMAMGQGMGMGMGQGMPQPGVAQEMPIPEASMARNREIGPRRQEFDQQANRPFPGDQRGGSLMQGTLARANYAKQNAPQQPMQGQGPGQMAPQGPMGLGGGPMAPPQPMGQVAPPQGQPQMNPAMLQMNPAFGGRR